MVCGTFVGWFGAYFVSGSDLTLLHFVIQNERSIIHHTKNAKDILSAWYPT
jgi:hypothetical protein